jgi:uncharacterized protein YqhQ
MPKGEYLQYGGQAIIEGVMMRSPKHFAVACRAPNGKIVLQTEPLAKTWIGRQRWLKLPFLRGTLALLDAMALGIRAMNFAAKVQTDPVYGGDPKDHPATISPTAALGVGEGVVPSHVHSGNEVSVEGSEILRPQSKGGDSLMKLGVAGAMIFGLGLGVLLFVATPVWLAQLFKGKVVSDTGVNVIEGVIKAAIFLGYIGLIGLTKEVGEVFKFHGAEHKAINVLEAGDELNMKNAMGQTRLHPRCGTSFAIIVLLISIVLFTILPRDFHMGSTALNLLVRIGLKLLVLPFIAGIAYEAIRIAGKFRSEAWVKAAFWPGLMTQYLTTREPEEKHTEVALVALRAVVDAEKADKTPEPAPAEIA